MKYLAKSFLLILFSLQLVKAQESDMQLKANLLTLPVSVFNLAIEKKMTEHISIQPEIFISPWKSFMDKHAQLYLAGIDGRYYFNQTFKKFYIGLNISAGYFNIQKWNYWNDNIFVHTNGEATEYINRNLYQEGFTFIVGVVGGYQFVINDRLGLDLFLGIGNMQSFYKGYDKVSGERYDSLEDRKGRVWDRSGEWLPYKGGLMLTYKLN